VNLHEVWLSLDRSNNSSEGCFCCLGMGRICFMWFVINSTSCFFCGLLLLGLLFAASR
jgi:hypothetical protein